MRILETEILIEASPELVWSILTDFKNFPEWNPFITKATGQITVGEKLEVLIDQPNGKTMLFKPTVKTVEKNSELRWLGHLLFPGIFDGEHIFTITPKDDGCLLVQKEIFRGLLIPFFWTSLDTETRNGFIAMNNALKQRAENKRS